MQSFLIDVTHRSRLVELFNKLNVLTYGSHFIPILFICLIPLVWLLYVAIFL